MTAGKIPHDPQVGAVSIPPVQNIHMKPSTSTVYSKEFYSEQKDFSNVTPSIPEESTPFPKG